MPKPRKKSTSDLLTVEEAWKQIGDWLRVNAPEVSLPEGASESEIEEVESVIGFKLPSDVRASYLQHNGSNRLGLVEQGYLMPLQKTRNLPRRKQALLRSTVDSWTSMNKMLQQGYFRSLRSEPTGPISEEWWNSQWVPMTDNQCGDCLCIDMAPTSGGRSGQIIDWWHEQGATHVVAASFQEWLSALTTRLHSGQCRFDPKENAIKQIKP